MDSSKLVTIMLSAYNHENFVQETIESIINQTYQNIELLVINDGSPDSTHEKIMQLYEKCKERFTRFEYINRENKGLIASINELNAMAKGYYILGIASDDFCTKNRIKLQVKSLEENQDYGMCYGRMISVDKNSNIITSSRTTKYNKSGYLFNDLLFRNFITAPTVMMKKSVLDEVGGFDARFKIEDHPLWLKIAKKYKIYYLDEYLIYYRDHDSNISKNISFMIEENEKMLNSYSDEPMYKKAIARHNLYCFIQLVKVNEKKLATKYMLKAFPNSWHHPKYLKGVIRYLLKKDSLAK
ncbi:glycosyltransferase [Sulfurimonas sp.]|nr:glycosyltransferase [Sulfurimonas sp.]